MIAGFGSTTTFPMPAVRWLMALGRALAAPARPLRRERDCFAEARLRRDLDRRALREIFAADLAELSGPPPLRRDAQAAGQKRR